MTIPDPRAERKVIPLHRGSIMAETLSAPAPKTSKRLHKTPYRMSDPGYLSLTPGAKAALAAFDQVGAVTGNAARCAGMLGLDRKTFNLAIEQLDGKFITVERDEEVLTCTPVDPQLIPSCTPVGNKQSAKNAGLRHAKNRPCDSTEKEALLGSSPLCPPPSTPSPSPAPQTHPLSPPPLNPLPGEVMARVVCTLIAQDGRPFAVTAGRVAEWQAAFPTLDVEAEIRAAAVWHDANPKGRKTYAGMARYLSNWLLRARDRPKRQHEQMALSEVRSGKAKERDGNGVGGVAAGDPAGGGTGQPFGLDSIRHLSLSDLSRQRLGGGDRAVQDPHGTVG